MEKKKRRSSQVFNFQQTEETKEEALEQNEALKDLYQNKNYVQPEPKEFETIIEEGGEKEEHRSRRGAAAVTQDGGLVLGRGKDTRSIEGYKFWKQDDKDRNKKRKLMLAKQWKGRKKLKMILLDMEAEQRLQEIIEAREESEDEEVETGIGERSRVGLFGVSDGCRGQTLCVWGKGREGSGSSLEEEGGGCVWEGRSDETLSKDLPEPGPPSSSSRKSGTLGHGSGLKTDVGLLDAEEKEVEIDQIDVGVVKRGRPINKKGKEKKTEEISPVEVIPIPIVVVTEGESNKKSNEGRVAKREGSGLRKELDVANRREESVHSRDGSVCSTSEVSLATLYSLIPAGELEGLLESEDLLFCGGKVDEKVANSRNKMGRESVRRSVRRSARLQHTPLLTGSVFTEEELDIERNYPKEDKGKGEFEKRVGGEFVDEETTDVIAGSCDDVFNEVEPEENLIPKPNVVVSPILSSIRHPPCLAKLLVPPTSIVLTMTPPPLSKDSKENLFLNNFAKLKVTKKVKTKRRAPAPATASPNAVLKDLSNLSIGSKHTINVPKIVQSDIIANAASSNNTKTNNSSMVNKATNINTVKTTKSNMMDMVSGRNMVKTTKAGVTNRRKKKTIQPSPDTSDESFHCFGNIEPDNRREGKKGKRLSLRLAGGRGTVTYFEESERSGTMSREGSRRSSMEGSRRTSLEGSRRNSVLALSGEREIDISMPDAVRRSQTGHFVKRTSEPFLVFANEVKSVASVGDAFWSDSEEEEIISGIFGKKTLRPLEQKYKKEINRGFLN